MIDVANIKSDSVNDKITQQMKLDQARQMNEQSKLSRKIKEEAEHKSIEITQHIIEKNKHNDPPPSSPNISQPQSSKLPTTAAVVSGAAAAWKFVTSLAV
jgi:hypothetical protein